MVAVLEKNELEEYNIHIDNLNAEKFQFGLVKQIGSGKYLEKRDTCCYPRSVNIGDIVYFERNKGYKLEKHQPSLMLTQWDIVGHAKDFYKVDDLVMSGEEFANEVERIIDEKGDTKSAWKELSMLIDNILVKLGYGKGIIILEEKMSDISDKRKNKWKDEWID